MQADKTMDCKGMACPMPIVKLSKVVKELAPGQVLAVIADDPGFEADVKAWCENTNNRLEEFAGSEAAATAYIRKT